MKIPAILIAAVAATLAAGTPALAQMQGDSMKKGEMSSDKGMMSSNMKMSAADKRMMAKCKGMSREVMMKDKGCAKMMKMHPEMMKGG